MNNRINWTTAAYYGLLLSSISVVLNLLAAFFEISGTLGIVFTILGIFGNFYLLYYIMRRNADTEEGITYGSSFRYGMAVCMFSTIVCCLMTLLTYTVFIPDYMESTLTILFEQFDSMGMADVMDYDTLLGQMPVYLVIGEAINCLFCGLLFSAIIARRTINYDNDPFAGVEDAQEE